MSLTIVNITTTLHRLTLCCHTVWSLLNQVALPDKIVIWVSAEPYLMDTGITNEPSWMKSIREISDIVEFRWTSNTGPYRKIFPALKSFNAEDILIYADDDTIYKPDWLRLLLDKYAFHNGEFVVASRVKVMKRNIFGKFATYTLWPLIYDDKVIEADFLITGVGGAVMQKKHIAEHLVLNETYLTLCPRTDDIWISEIVARSGTQVATCPRAMSELYYIHHDYGLINSNTPFAKKLLARALNRFKSETLGRAGIALCNNDTSLRAVRNYFAKTPEIAK